MKITEMARVVNPLSHPIVYTVAFGATSEQRESGIYGVNVQVIAKCEKDARAIAERYAEEHSIPPTVFSIAGGRSWP